MAIPIRKANPKPLPLSSQDLQTLARDATNATRLKQTLDYLVGAVSEALAEKQKQDGTVFSTGQGQPTPVVGAYGVRTVELAGRMVAVGMMVREDGGSIVPASNETIGTYGAATAFVLEVNGQFAKIASGAASAPLLVTAPVIGETVYLASNGNGTCNLGTLTAVDPDAETQAVAVCEDTRMDASGCVRCASVSFGGAQVQSAAPLSDIYWRKDGSNGPSTGDWTLDYDVVINNSKTVTWFGPSPKSITIGNNQITFGSGLNFLNITVPLLTGSASVEFQDAGGTVALLEVAQTWTDDQTFDEELIANGLLVTPSNAQVISAVGDTIDATVSPYAYLTNTTGNITLTSTPTIADGVDGQILVVMNSTGSTGRVILQREATLAGSNLSLGAASRVLFPGGSITLIFSSTSGLWMELAFTTSTS